MSFLASTAALPQVQMTTNGYTYPVIIVKDYGTSFEGIPLHWVNYSDVAWWDSYYATKPLNTLPTQLFNKVN
jgi:hypothetical protein